ncbi:MAG: flagellar biosynthesis anti-sigma factor FlgM [Phycisphaerales bacterium]
MESIAALNGLSSVTLGRPVALAAAGTAPAAYPRVIDSVEISDEAREASETDRPVRQGRVDEVKGALAAGTYLHPDKFERAIDRLLRDLQD